VRPPPKARGQAGLWHGVGSRTACVGFVSKVVFHEATHGRKTTAKSLHGTGTAQVFGADRRPALAAFAMRAMRTNLVGEPRAGRAIAERLLALSERLQRSLADWRAARFLQTAPPLDVDRAIGSHPVTPARPATSSQKRAATSDFPQAMEIHNLQQGFPVR
jgi:hypothetical protein